jgi:hypothetical protein
VTTRSRGSARRTAGLIGLAVVVALIAVPGAWAQSPTPSTDIHSAGPLTDVWIGSDLSCQVARTGASDYEFYPATINTSDTNNGAPGDCGTFLYVSADDEGNFLYGPYFSEHPESTDTPFSDVDSYTPFTGGTQTLTGSGTSASPYRLTTTIPEQQDDGSGLFTITEVDSYIIGDEYYRTDITVTNEADFDLSAILYHAGDCFVQGSDSGFGYADPSNGTTACTGYANNSPAGPLAAFSPLTTGSNYVETADTTTWDDIANDEEHLPNTCDCTTSENNAAGLDWDIPSLAPDQETTFSLLTNFSAAGNTGFPLSATGSSSFSGTPSAVVTGTMATFTDPDTLDSASDFSATINWGDGTSSSGTITGANGSFSVTGRHNYGAAGSFPIAVTISQAGDPLNSVSANDTAIITAAPAPVLTGAPPVITSTGAELTGAVNPSGLATTAFFQYGLDPKYSGAGPIAYSDSTPSQPVGSGFTSTTVSAPVTGLVPNALYHVRLVATNADGTTFGPDVTFRTASAPAPGSPTLGKTFNISLVSGLVLVKIHGVFVPLTELTQIPANTEINALHGSIKLVTALPAGAKPTADVAAKGKSKSKTTTQNGTFGGAIFKITQAHNGLATLALVENAFKGAPSYALCTKPKAGDASAAALSSKTLQLLHASAHGKFSTKGRYSAAAVRGTIWTVADRCDGTLTHDVTDSVAVTDFVHHKTIILHAGQSYLARPVRRAR